MVMVAARRRTATIEAEPEEVPAPDLVELTPEEEEIRATEQRVYRVSGVTYLHIPARDAYEASHFFQAVFGWSLRGDPEHPYFDDGTGHVLGTWVTHRSPAPESGILPYVYVENLDETLDKVCANGGQILMLPFQEGDSRIATFTDPSGNAFGIWQRGRR